MLSQSSPDSRQIQRAIIGYHDRALWNPGKCLAALNTTGVVGWEADIVVIQPSGWVYEIEVKISAGDFRREFTAKSKQAKHQTLQSGVFVVCSPLKIGDFRRTCRENLVRKFFYAMPKDILDKVAGEIPPHAGVIALDEHLCPTIEKKAPLLQARAATLEDRQRVFESVYYRSWRAS